MKYIDEVVLELESDALCFGRAFDAYIQGEAGFSQRFTVVPARFDVAERIERNQGKIKELVAKGCENEGGKPMTKAQISAMEKAAELRKENEELLDLADKTQITPIVGEKLPRMLTELRRSPLFSFNPENAQVAVEIDYKGHKIGGTMDELDLAKGEIADIKTAASLDSLNRRLDDGQTPLEKYKAQLSFYQFLVQVKHEILCDGVLKITTKEDVPKHAYYRAEAKSLLDNRGAILARLDDMVETVERGIFASSPREKCLRCSAWGVCPFSVQTKYIQI